MWRARTGLKAAAIILALGLAAQADEPDPQAEAKQQTAERERRGDAEAGERERQPDREAGERQRRRDEAAPRDEGRRGPPDRPRGPIGRKEMMEGMMGGPGMRPIGMRPMPGMGGMMGGGGMGGMSGMMMGMGMPPDDLRLRESDPEMFELEQNDRRLDRESHELAEQYRRTPEGPAREELRGKLQEVVARHFKTRQERRELEVKRLEAQLERLRGALERRSKDADAIIDRRMSQMLGDEDFGF